MSKKAAFGLSDDAARLAEVVSFAARVDPTLLREARLRMLPELDAGVEADVWLCPAVEAADRRGFLFSPEAGSVLRERLWLRGRKQYDDAWKLTKDLHAHLPAAEQAEEKLQYLELLSDDARNPEESSRAQAREQIQKLLRSVIASMVAGPQSGLAHWAARLLARHGKWLPQQPDAQMLADAAHLRLDGVMRRSEDHEKLPAWLSWVAPKDFPRERIAVRLREGQLEAGSPDELATDAAERDGLAILETPRTTPLVLEAVEGSTVRRLELRKNEQKRWGMQRVEVAHGDRVLLRTIFGERFELESQPSVDARLSGEILDFSSLLELQRPFKGRNPYFEVTIATGTWTWIAGGPGTGKTAICANVVDQLSQSSSRVAYHFFRADVPEWRDVGVAFRSIAAQLESAFPRFAGREATAIGRIAGILTRHAESADRLGLEPIFLVLDGCEVVGRKALEPLLSLPLGPRGGAVATVRSQRQVLTEKVQSSNPRRSIQTVMPPGFEGLHPGILLDEEPAASMRQESMAELARKSGISYERVREEVARSWHAMRLELDLLEMRFDTRVPTGLEQLYTAVVAWGRQQTEGFVPALHWLLAERELVPKSLVFRELAGSTGPDSNIESQQNISAPFGGQRTLAMFGELRRLLAPIVIEVGDRIGIRSEELREAWSHAAGREEMQRAHESLIQDGEPASWPTRAVAGSQAWTYAVRNVLFHAREAMDRQAFDRVFLDASYLEARIAAGDLDGLQRDLREPSEYDDDAMHGVMFTLNQAREELVTEPAALPEIHYSQVIRDAGGRDSGWWPIRMPMGRPLLRPWKTVEIGPASNQPPVLSDVVGGRLSADGIAALWAEDGRLFFLHPEEGAEDLLSGTPRVVTAFAGARGIVAARFLPKKLLAVAGGDGSLSVIDAESGALVFRRAASTVALRGIELLEPHERPEASLRQGWFYVVTWDAKNELRVWDFAGFDPRADHSGLFATHHALDVPQGIACVKMTPGGATLLIGREDGVVLELNLGDSSLALAFRGKAAVTDLQIDATEKRVVAGFADGTVGAWTLDGFEPRGTVRASELSVRSVMPMGEGATAVLGVHGKLAIFGNADLGENLGPALSESPVRELARSDEGLFAECDDGVLHISAVERLRGVPVKTNAWSQKAETLHSVGMSLLGVSRDGTASLIRRDRGGPSSVPGMSQSVARLDWDAASLHVRSLSSHPEELCTLLPVPGFGCVASLPGNSYDLMGVDGASRSIYKLPPAYRVVARSSNQETQIATSDGFGLLVLRFVKEGEPPEQETIWYGEPLYDQAVSSDGRMIVALSSMNRLLVFDLERRGRFEFDLGATGPIGPGDRCAVSDALAAAVVRRSGSLVVYDLTERRAVANTKLSARAISCEFETPDRLRLTFDSGAIEVFSSPTLEAQEKVAAGARVTVVVPGDPSTGFVVCRSDGAVTLAGRGQSEDWSVAAHRRAVTAAVRFAHDRALATASLDGWIKLWRESDGTLLAALPLHAPILAMVESAGRLVARTADGKLHFVRRPCVVLSHEVVEATVSLAVRLVELLAERGIDVRERYTSRRMEDEVEAMDREMEEAIDAADVLVPFIVPAQMRETRYVEREVAQALRRREARAPLSIVPVVVGRESATEELESVRPWSMLGDDTAVFVDYGGNPERDIESLLDTILRAVAAPPRGSNPRDDDRPQAMAEQNLA